MEPHGFYNDAARRVATFFEKWNCKIETCLRARRESPPKRLTHTGFFAIPLLEHGGLQPILPFLEWRSDAACRVATPFPFMPAWGVNVGRIYTPRRSPRNADCRGVVFATRRFPRPPPPHVYHPGPRQSRIIDAPPLIATRRATSLQTPPHHPPTCAPPSPHLGRCTLGFHAKIRGCSGPGRRMVGRRWGAGLYCTLP